LCAQKKVAKEKIAPRERRLATSGCAGALAARQRRAASETRATRSNRRSPFAAMPLFPPPSARLGALEGGFAPLIPILHRYRSIELVIASEVKQSIFLKKLEKLDCFVTSRHASLAAKGFFAMTVK